MRRIAQTVRTRSHLALGATYAAWATAAVLPLALLACSDRPADGEPVTDVPAVVTELPGAVGGSAAALETAHDAIVEVSYADAEQVYREGRYSEAAALFEEYVRRRPDNPWGHFMLGLSAARSGEPVRAEQAFDRALQLDPQHVKSYLNSARVLLDLGRAHEALERAELALAVDSASGEALRLAARAMYQLGDLSGAEEAYRQALTLDERDLWAMNNLGLIYIEQARPDQAIPPLARAVQLRSTAPVFQNNLGIALERVGRFSQAAVAFEAALAADSTYGKARVSLDRVRMLSDTTLVPVDLVDAAERFRLQVRIWREQRETSPPPVVEPVRDTVTDHE